jgi:hypothetical protein
MVADYAQLQLYLKHPERALLVEHTVLVTDCSKHDVLGLIILSALLE